MDQPSLDEEYPMFEATTTVEIGGRAVEIWLRLRHSTSSGVHGQWWFTGRINGRQVHEPDIIYQFRAGYLGQAEIDRERDYPALKQAILDAIEHQEFVCRRRVGRYRIQIAVSRLGFSILRGWWRFDGGSKHDWRYVSPDKKLFVTRAKELPGLVEAISQLVHDFTND